MRSKEFKICSHAGSLILALLLRLEGFVHCLLLVFYVSVSGCVCVGAWGCVARQQATISPASDPELPSWAPVCAYNQGRWCIRWWRVRL